MIIDKKILVKIDRSNIEYYKKFDYNIKLKDILEIDVDKLQRGSNKKVKVKCDNCDSENSVKYYTYMNNIENWNIYLCAKCSDKFKMEKTYKTNLEKYGVKIFNNREKSIETNLEKYGVENVSQSKEIKEKRKETNLKNWGVEVIFQSEKLKEQFKKTKKEKYGDENFTNRKKSKETCFMNNGVEWPTQSKEVLKTRNSNNKEKYGVEHYTQTEECKDRVRKTCLEKYSKESFLASYTPTEECKDRVRKTCIKKYGKEYYSQTEECKNRIKKTCNEKYGVDNPSQFFEIHMRTFLRFKTHEIGIKYQGTYEKDFLDLCQKFNLNVVRGKTIKFRYEDKNKIYFSDYYLKDFNLIIEIKSSYIYNLHEELNLVKQKTVLEQGYNFLFIMDKKYEDFLEFVKINI